jgi:hypothetical protein
MPARWLCLGIIAFWLGTSAWMFWTDIWPDLQPNEPPPVTIDLTVEVRTQRPSYPWTVYQWDRKSSSEKKKAFQARTEVARLGPDEFELTATYSVPPGYAPAKLYGCTIKHATSIYRVNARGDLRALSVSADWLPPVLQSAPFTTRIGGVVHNRQFQPTLTVKVDGAAETTTIDLPQVHVSRGASVLLPHHPFNRMLNLTPGQRWRVPAVDPLNDSLTRKLNLFSLDSGPRFLNVHVLAEPEGLDEGRYAGRPCLVVEYKGEGVEVKTWVEERTGLVLRQLAFLDGVEWDMIRE